MDSHWGCDFACVTLTLWDSVSLCGIRVNYRICHCFAFVCTCMFSTCLTRVYRFMQTSFRHWLLVRNVEVMGKTKRKWCVCDIMLKYLSSVRKRQAIHCCFMELHHQAPQLISHTEVSVLCHYPVLAVEVIPLSVEIPSLWTNDELNPALSSSLPHLNGIFLSWCDMLHCPNQASGLCRLCTVNESRDQCFPVVVLVESL